MTEYCMTETENLTIREAEPLNARACATIHQQEIATGFLSKLGVPFLGLLYAAMIQSQQVVCFVAEDKNGQVVGFISGCFHVGKFYKEFLIKYGLKASLVILPQVVKPMVLKGIFEMLRYQSNDDAPQLPEAELLSIAVRPHVRGTAVAQKLVEALFNRSREREAEEIMVVVGGKNIRANKFYQKVGFRFHSETSVHGAEVSNIYVKSLD